MRKLLIIVLCVISLTFTAFADDLSWIGDREYTVKDNLIYFADTPYPYTMSGVPVLGSAAEYLCEEHRVLDTGYSTCPICTPLYRPSWNAWSTGEAHELIGTPTYGFTNGVYDEDTELTYIRWSAGDDFTADNNGDLISPTANGTEYLLVAYPDVYQAPNGLAWLQINFESNYYTISEAEHAQRIRVSYMTVPGNFNNTGTQYVTDVVQNDDGSYTASVLFKPTNMQTSKTYLGIIFDRLPNVSFEAGATVLTLGQAFITPEDDPTATVPPAYPGDPPGPMSPPTDSDKWVDEQMQNAVDPELEGKLDEVDRYSEGITNFENDMWNQLDQYYDSTTPDNWEMTPSLIASMRWISGQFMDGFESIGYQYTTVVLFPVFLGLALFLMGRGGQAMASTQLRINRMKERDKD